MNQNIKYINYLNNNIMKTTKKRNIIYLNKDGRYSLVGLNKNERESLISEREILSKHIGAKVIDEYIIPLYNKESNEVYFTNEKTYSSDERAIIITERPKRLVRK